MGGGVGLELRERIWRGEGDNWGDGLTGSPRSRVNSTSMIVFTQPTAAIEILNAFVFRSIHGPIKATTSNFTESSMSIAIACVVPLVCANATKHAFTNVKPSSMNPKKYHGARNGM